MPMLLRRLTDADADVALAAHAELARDHFSFLIAWRDEPFGDYLDRLARMEQGIDVGTFVASIFLVAEDDGEIVGRASIRPELNEMLLREGGHIGYGVRPQYRRRGYATEILRQSLDIVGEHGVTSALVTCDDDNAGSAATIERCGGVLENVIEMPEGQVPRRRYWVPVPSPA